MAQIAIDQKTARITIIIAGEPTRAERYENRGTQDAPDWQPTGEYKTNKSGTPLWSIPATILVLGSATAIATKVTIASEKCPDVPPVGSMVRADGLELSVYSPQVSATALHPLAPAMPENGGK